MSILPESHLLPIDSLRDAYLRLHEGRDGEPLGSPFATPAEGRRPSLLSLDQLVLAARPRAKALGPLWLQSLPLWTPVLVATPPPGNKLRLWRSQRRWPKGSKDPRWVYRDRWVISEDYDGAPALAVVQAHPRFWRHLPPLTLCIKGQALRMGLGAFISRLCLSGSFAELVMQEVHAALDIDLGFSSTIIFEDSRYPGRKCEPFMATELCHTRVNYLRLRAREAPFHWAVYNADDARFLATSAHRKGFPVPVPPERRRPLRAEARLRPARLGIESTGALRARLPDFFAGLKLIALPPAVARALPRGALLSLSWVQRHGLTRTPPTLARLEKRRAATLEMCVAGAAGRTSPHRRGPGLPVLMDSGDVVLDALLRRHQPEDAERIARAWYTSAVRLLAELGRRYAPDLGREARSGIESFIASVDVIVGAALGPSTSRREVLWEQLRLPGFPSVPDESFASPAPAGAVGDSQGTRAAAR